MAYFWSMSIGTVKRAVPFLVLGFVGTWMAVHQPVQAGEQNLTVVELYTSQGCSSCPPADALLGELVKQKNVLGLSFHVDYWDYIGWRDPYAKSAYSKRQKGYAATFKKSFVYTPQIVVHGVKETTGSDEYSVKGLIRQAATAPNVPIEIVRTKLGGLTVTVSAGKRPAQATVWIALYDKEHVTHVKRGENRGRTIRNYNVVRYFEKVGEWQGKKLLLTIPAALLKAHSGDGCAIILQSATKGPILGAAAIALNR